MVDNYSCDTIIQLKEQFLKCIKKYIKAFSDTEKETNFLTVDILLKKTKKFKIVNINTLKSKGI